ncbi:MAG: hypothetical protein COS84_02770 [Armatimonadetes bacterium CG07_land_8_20_14_0_80_40_9]|nr:MAG: hypothetical protein COS84_02770 [Armatimonadetes bacterium CG07_land_8_20_14_0_80_40_9]
MRRLSLILLILMLLTVRGFAQTEKDKLISMNFQGADIQQVVNFLSELTGKTIIVGEEVKGRITVVSLAKIRADEALNVLNSVLRVRGFTMVETEKVIKVISLEESIQTEVETKIGIKPEEISALDKVITQIMPIKHIDASKVRVDLKPLVGKYGNILSNERTNTLIISDSAANIKRLATIISHLDKEMPPLTQIKVFTLDYAEATKLAAILSQLPKSEATEKGIPGGMGIKKEKVEEGEPLEMVGDVTFLADERSNSLVVATSPQNFPGVEKLIKDLDSMLSQVLIEVLIMEVTLDKETKFGIEWDKLEKQGLDVGRKDLDITSSLDWGLKGEEFGLKGVFKSKDGAIDLLSFLYAKKARVNILSTPLILTSDNKKARIMVGEEIPCLKETRRTEAGEKDYIYEYKEVGIVLEITPHISEERSVVLDVKQEVKKLGEKSLFDAYMFISRIVEATVMVGDKETIVIGGLIRDDKTVGEYKVPVLGDIPLLGNLFKKKITSSVKTELLMFITPHVITSAKELEEVTKEQKGRMKHLPGRE